jgi:phospholipase D1/2
VNTATTTRRARWLLLGCFVLLIAAAVILWRYTPLAQFITAQRLSDWLGTFRGQAWAPFAVVGLFVIGGLVIFPVLLLIAATSLVFSPLIAFVVALAGTVVSATITYLVGARFVRGTAQTAFGPMLQKVSAALKGRGVLAIAAIRIVPIAPFTVLNVAAGSIGVPLTDFLIGTVLGMLPGMIAITAFGQQLRAVLDHPTPLRVAALVGLIAAWLGLSLLLQKLVARRP